MNQQSQPSTTVALAAGTHWICSCGRSNNFPYCDGRHQGTTFQPLALEIESPKVVEISI